MLETAATKPAQSLNFVRLLLLSSDVINCSFHRTFCSASKETNEKAAGSPKALPRTPPRAVELGSRQPTSAPKHCADGTDLDFQAPRP